MINEWHLDVASALKMLLISTFATCYIIGGRSHKWIRRFLGGALFSTGCLLAFAWDGVFHWWLCLPLFSYIPALTLGYSDKKSRVLYGVVLGGLGLIVGIMNHVPSMAGMQAVMAVSASVILGLKNPTHAVYEECMIAVLSVVMVPFMVPA